VPDPIDFAQAKKDRTPHLSGEAVCLHCKHEWVAVAPVGTVYLECPECAQQKGIFRWFCSPEVKWACLCGNIHFQIVPGPYIYCILCGTTSELPSE
jgi:hypothetical protein